MRARSHSASALLAAAALAAACAPRVNVVGSGKHAPAKPSDCTIRFFREPPGPIYDELGELRVETPFNSPARAQEAMRERACALGADAVVITQELTDVGNGGVMVGTALKFRGMPKDPLHTYR